MIVRSQGLLFEIPDDVVIRVGGSRRVKSGGPPYEADESSPATMHVEVSDLGRVLVDGVPTGEHGAGVVGFPDVLYDEGTHSSAAARE